MDEQKELEKNSAPAEHVEEVPDIEIPTLRTYKSDINRTVHQDKITTAKILMAEQRKESVSKEKKSQTSVKKPGNLFALIFGVLFVAGAIGLIGYFGYTKIIKKTFQAINIAPSFLFIFDDEQFIDASKDRTQVISEVDQTMTEIAQMKDGTFTDIIFTTDDTNTDETVRITSSKFFEIYGIALPTNISRSISQDFVYGVYKTNGRIEPFLVVGLVDFENAFDTMFIWETTLALDIKDIFPVLKNLFDISKRSTIIDTPVVATSTASTTITSTSTISASTTATTASSTPIEELSPEEEFQRQNELRQIINRTIRFVDIVLYNRDVRGVRDSNGNPFFYYTFVDRNKILFAQDDPLVLHSLLDSYELPPNIEIYKTKKGGHVGYLGNPMKPHGFYWLDSLLVEWVLDRNVS